VVIRSH